MKNVQGRSENRLFRFSKSAKNGIYSVPRVFEAVYALEGYKLYIYWRLAYKKPIGIVLKQNFTVLWTKTLVVDFGMAH